MLRAAALSVVAWSCFSAGCFDASSSTAAISYPTTITVQPTAFRGAIACGGAGLHRYVVTLTDVTRGDAAADALATTSARPTACTLPTSFSLERAVGRAFTAEIDGYDRDDIAPAAPGSREMHDLATGAIVCPIWQSTCGEDDRDGGNPLRRPTIVVELAETQMTGCAPLTPASGACGTATDLDASVNDARVDGMPAPADAHAEPAPTAADADASMRADSAGDAADVSLPLDAAREAAADVSDAPSDAIDARSDAADATAPRTDDAGDALSDGPAQVLDDVTREGG